MTALKSHPAFATEREKKLTKVQSKCGALLKALVATGSLLGKHKASRTFFSELAEEVLPAVTDGCELIRDKDRS
jgi:hypothetical protein